MAFVTEAALIALREGLEALLITGILLGLVDRLGRPDARKHVWAGFAAAVATSLLAGWAIQRYLLTAFQERGLDAWFTLVAALVAIATLLYMVFWMWQHTAKVLGEAKRKVRAALTTGSLVTIAFITYISTLREGLETVLFYAALAGRETAGSLVFSGAVGFAASALIVYAILRTSRHVSVRAFFTATGLWLIVVAAMLSTHVVEAATGLGLIEPAPAIWDTSGLIAGDSVLGRILHAAVGYTAAPTLLQAIGYFGILFVAGGAYLYRQGAFTASTTEGARPRTGRVVAACVAVLLVASTVAVAAANPTDRMLDGHHHGPGEEHAHDDGEAAGTLPEDTTVGVMLRAHGEPVEYNATTYAEFADFTRKLLIQLGYEQLLEVDQGTVLVDEDRPYDKQAHLDPDLMDAWLTHHEGPAVYVGSPVPERAQAPVADGMYVMPGGPGLGEPDVLEAAGLGVWKDYRQMENTSRMHEAKTAILDTIEATLEERFGEQIVVERAHHIRPMIDPEEESLEASVRELVEADVDAIVDAYTSHLHSDIMNECMKKQHFQQALEDEGFTGPVLEAGPSGLTESFAEGMAEAVAAKADAYPEDADLWISLTHHGADPNLQSQCHDRRDPYVNQTFEMFENVEAELANRSLATNATFHMVYGNGAGDPDDGIYSPTEAVENASAQGAKALLDIPYELPGDGFDNLVQHRLNYGLDPRQAPHYGPGYETHLTREGIDVTVTSSAFAGDTRAKAQVEAIEEALRPLYEEPDEDHGG